MNKPYGRTLRVIVSNAATTSLVQVPCVPYLLFSASTTSSVCFGTRHELWVTFAGVSNRRHNGPWWVASLWTLPYAHVSCPDISCSFCLVLTKLVYSIDDEILIDACWATSILPDGSNNKIQSVIESRVCRRLVDLLMHNSISVKIPALRSVGNMVIGDDLQTGCYRFWSFPVVLKSGWDPAGMFEMVQQASFLMPSFGEDRRRPAEPFPVPLTVDVRNQRRSDTLFLRVASSHCATCLLWWTTNPFR